MKRYPAILGPSQVMKRLGTPDCIAFVKYDGSNIRFSWSKQKGWWQFGTRYRTITIEDPEYSSAISIFMENLANPLTKILKDIFRADAAIVYTEFFGPHSFSGQHAVSMLNRMGIKCNDNEPKELVLIDVNIHKKGLVNSQEFVNTFVSNLPKRLVAQPVYFGPLNQQFIEDVYLGRFPVHEGVVCKGGLSQHSLWFAKIKTKQYLEELKRYLPTSWQEQWDWEQ